MYISWDVHIRDFLNLYHLPIFSLKKIVFIENEKKKYIVG